MKKLLFPIAILFCQFLFGQHQNVKISSINSPQEPTVCLNYLKPENIVAGANTNQYYYSGDGGLTWTRNVLNSSYGVSGDPCVVSDKFGDFYYLHLSNPQDGSWLDRIVCQKSSDNGKTWSNGSYMGWEAPKDQDKEWASIDFSNNFIYTTWTQFDIYGTANTDKKSNILFSRSEDKGATWSNAIQINELSGDCIDSDNTAEGAVPAVGPNGEVYVAWALNEKIYFNKSFDHGKTWLSTNIEVATQPSGWDLSIPGIFRCNGLPVTCADTSSSKHRGNIYVNWTDQRNGSNDTDVWFSKSNDEGETWSAAKRVNNDTSHTHQFLTWMTIDQSNGAIYFVFYDRRNYDDESTDVYMAVSKDGGATFDNFKISEKPFYPRDDVFFGDYNNITAYKNIVRPIWTRLNYSGDENGLSLWTAIIDTEALGIANDETFAVTEDVIYPNPARHLSFYSFKLREKAVITLELYDSYGRIVKKIISNEELVPGKYIKEMNLAQEHLLPGLYFYVLSNNDNRSSKKLIITDN